MCTQQQFASKFIYVLVRYSVGLNVHLWQFYLTIIRLTLRKAIVEFFSVNIQRYSLFLQPD